MINPKGIQSDPNKIVSKLFRAQGYLLSSYDKPSQMFEITFEDFSKSLENVVKDVNNYFQFSFADLIKDIDEAGLSLIEKYEPIEFK